MSLSILDKVSKRLALAAALVAWGCSSGGAGTDAGSPGTAGSGGSVGNGGSGPGAGGASATDPTPFLGIWTETATLGGAAPCSPVTDTRQITVTAPTPSSLLRTETSGETCQIPLTIIGAGHATLATPQQCSISVGSVGTGTVSFTTWSMVVTGNMGTESASGTLAIAGVSCPVTFSATLTR